MSAQVLERTRTQTVHPAWDRTELVALAAVRLGEMFRSIVTGRVGVVLGKRGAEVVVVEIPAQRRRVA